MSFWTAEDKVPVEQKKVSVPATHGLNYSPGQKIEFQIPAGLEFIQPKESYLRFDVKLSKDPRAESADPPNPITRLQLDQWLGGQVLIKDLRVYSGGAGRILLEEFQDYNCLTAVKYDYETNDTLKAKRALTEGANVFNPATRSTTGEDHDSLQNLGTNPYWETPQSASYDSSDIVKWDEFETVKCLLPLNTGIFQNDKIFPVGMTDGLIVEIILEGVDKSIKCLDTTLRNRKLWGNPLFLSSSHTLPNSAPRYPVAVNASRFDNFFVRRDNLMGVNTDVGISNFPFVVGEEIQFINASSGVINPSIANGSLRTFISGIEYVGGTINAVRVWLDGFYRPTTTFDKNTTLYSTAAEKAANFKPSYEITNCEFIAQQVTMPSGYTSKLASMMKEGGSMNYDFLSWRNYKVSQIASELVATLRIPLTESRAKCLLCVPTDASVYPAGERISASDTPIENYSRNVMSTDNDDGFDEDDYHHLQNHSNRTGYTGITDDLQRYQLFYDGKLNPNRKVECDRTTSLFSIDQQPLLELEKALVMGSIRPHSMLAFQRNFVIGRALSLQDGCYDARGKDFQLQLEYTGENAPDFNKLWMCWCGHLRRIEIKGNAISLQT
tara:strand:- start:9823 stop:11652 length:1830 start_codon:yes stop_codon:yes gene_type:complete